MLPLGVGVGGDGENVSCRRGLGRREGYFVATIEYSVAGSLQGGWSPFGSHWGQTLCASHSSPAVTLREGLSLSVYC